MLGLGLGYQERDWGVDLAYNALRASGSIQNPGDGQSWDLGANHQRGTVTYRARF